MSASRTTVPIRVVSRPRTPQPGDAKSWTGFGVRMSRAEIEDHIGRVTAKPREIRNVTPPPRAYVPPHAPYSALGRRQIAAQMRGATVEGEEFLVAVGPFRASGRDVAIVVGLVVLMLLVR